MTSSEATESDELKKLQLAVYNNAVWCDTVCQSHHVPGEFHETFWINQHQTPIYHPNLITLSPTANITPNEDALTALLTPRNDYTVSVKDSFAVLDLTSFGFRQLFQAQWIFRQVQDDVSRQRPVVDSRWKRIVSEIELLRWEEAWSQEVLSQNRLFLPALLHDVDISILAAYKENQIVAGAITNRTTEVVGLSNIFIPAQEGVGYWEGLLDRIAASYPGLHLVGYEQGESLALALRVGFKTIGPLCVWIKER